MPVTLDLAYVKLADMFTPGLDLTVGRQNLKIGQGFIVGNVNTWEWYSYNLLAPDLSLQTAFDAIKVDYKSAAAPLSVQAFMAKFSENAGAFEKYDNDDNLYGLSVLYAPENWSIEPYIVNDYNYNPGDTWNISTVGIRGTLDVPSIKGLSFKAEYARQFGKDNNYDDLDGWAGYIGGTYQFQSPAKPYITAQYTMYSGQSASSSNHDAFYLEAPSDLADNIGLIAYADLMYAWINSNGFLNGLEDGCGLKAAKIGFGFQPTDQLGVSLNWFNLAAAESQGAVSDAIGNEFDLSFKYAYSEDVSLGLDLGVFSRGDYLKSNPPNEISATDNPWEALASMKVAF
jgi:hypothetical protein